MVRDIIIPQVGETAEEEVIIVNWRKKTGDYIEEGEIFLDIETGKGTIELESAYEGTLLEVVAGEGETVYPLTVVGRIRPSR